MGEPHPGHCPPGNPKGEEVPIGPGESYWDQSQNNGTVERETSLSTKKKEPHPTTSCLLPGMVVV